ncbi:hypothetical protein [Mucilaginibacter sp.]
MKLLINGALIFILLSFCLYSCKKDEVKTISGKWYYAKTILTYYDAGRVYDTDTTNVSGSSYAISFNSNGTGETIRPGGDNNFTYSLSGSSLTVVVDTTSSTGQVGTVTTKLTILQLTNSSLKWMTTNTSGYYEVTNENDLVRSF